MRRMGTWERVILADEEPQVVGDDVLDFLKLEFVLLVGHLQVEVRLLKTVTVSHVDVVPGEQVEVHLDLVVEIAVFVHGGCLHERVGVTSQLRDADGGKECSIAWQ